MLADSATTIIVVEHKDRLTRFGFNYIETLLNLQNRRIEVVNLAGHGKEDLRDDLVAIIYSFCARLYGQRRAKRNTEQLIKELDLEKRKWVTIVNDTYTDCRTDEGVTVGLIDALIAICRVLRKRSLSDGAIQEALRDLACDEDFLWFCKVEASEESSGKGHLPLGE